jgi:hypothetical protein
VQGWSEACSAAGSNSLIGAAGRFGRPFTSSLAAHSHFPEACAVGSGLLNTLSRLQACLYLLAHRQCCTHTSRAVYIHKAKGSLTKWRASCHSPAAVLAFSLVPPWRTTSSAAPWAARLTASCRLFSRPPAGAVGRAPAPDLGAGVAGAAVLGAGVAAGAGVGAGVAAAGAGVGLATGSFGMSAVAAAAAPTWEQQQKQGQRQGAVE